MTDASTLPPGSRHRTWGFLGGLIVVASIALGVSVVLLGVTSDDDASSDWRVVHDGYGRVGEEEAGGRQVKYLAPMASKEPGETHAALEVTTAAYDDFDLTLEVRTVAQLRQQSPPNPWEMAWVLWHYADDQHFYYLTLKPNGWELGKADPAFPGAQRFLDSGSQPQFELGTWYDVRVAQASPMVSIWVDGQLLSRFTDAESPYTSGQVGLYTEDAYVQFADIQVG